MNNFDKAEHEVIKAALIDYYAKNNLDASTKMITVDAIKKVLINIDKLEEM